MSASAKTRDLPHTVYIHRGRDGSVLYIGCSSNLAGRTRSHLRERAYAAQVAGVFRNGKPHVIGAVPNFDTERIARLLDSEARPIGWHYHLIDVENLAVGYLAGRVSMSKQGAKIMHPPWDSNDLSRAVGVDPDQFDRHTAMGDVRWAMAIYDAVMSGAA